MILALAMVLLLTACGGNGGNAGTGGGSGGVQDGGAGNAGNTGNAGNAGSAGDAGEAAPEGLALGETAATDIVELTLDRADLTIAVENTWGDSYYLPKEYDAAEDAQNPFVAAVGHTLVAMTYTATNLDRASVEFDGVFNPTFITIGYNGESYTGETEYGMSREEGGEWEQDSSMNVLLMAGDTETHRCYIDIPVEAASLEDDFQVTFSLPNSAGETEDFTYVVTMADREAAVQAAQEAADAEAAAEAAADAEAMAEVDPALSEEIVSQLQGEWSYTSGPTSYVLQFDGAYCYVTATAGGYAISNEGPISVRRDYVVIEYTTGNSVRMPYTYENGEFSIYPIET